MTDAIDITRQDTTQQVAAGGAVVDVARNENPDAVSAGAVALIDIDRANGAVIVNPVGPTIEVQRPTRTIDVAHQFQTVTIERCATGPPGAPGAGGDGAQEVYVTQDPDPDTAPVGVMNDYVRFHLDTDGDVQTIYLGTP